MHSPQQNKKAFLQQLPISKSLLRKVAGTVIALFLPLFTKKGVSSLKQKKWKLLLDFAYSNQFRYQISVFADSFDFFNHICPKRIFLVENGKIALVHASMVITYYIKLFRTSSYSRRDKKLFLFLRYSNYCNSFPSFPHFSDSKGQMKVE